MNLNDFAAKLFPFLARLFLETGAFTPVVVGSGTAGSFTYDATNTKCQYTKIANRVFFNGRINVTATAVAPVGNLAITGLPLISGANSNNGNVLGQISLAWTGVNLQAGYGEMKGLIFGSATTSTLYEMGDNVARTIVQGGELGAAFDLWLEGSYQLD